MSVAELFKGTTKVDPSIRDETVITANQDRPICRVSIASFRNPHHLIRVVDSLLADEPIAFHGWGVSGMGSRVDRGANFDQFWKVKEGRPPGSKIPLLERPQDVVRHIDWNAVHPDFKYLEDPKQMKALWGFAKPFHLIFPYNAKGESLSTAVVTPAYDEIVAPATPYPTVSFFWMEDASLKKLMSSLKEMNPNAQIGVSSLNDPGETPPVNTPALLDYLRLKGTDKFRLVVEDPLFEPFNLASSHSQFGVPMVGQEPKWTMKRRGSVSAEVFRQLTGFDLIVPEGIKDVRYHDKDIDMDQRLEQAVRALRQWERSLLANPLKDVSRARGFRI